MKKNNDSPYFKNWTTKKLKEEAVSYDELINGVGCYGKRELICLQGILAELEDRGVEIINKLSFN
jgi:hypothetical protein